MKIAVQLQPGCAVPPRVEYRWDADTEILSAQLRPASAGIGMSGSVGLEGRDGSWVILDVASGRIAGVEVAVWPDVRRRATFAAPTVVEDADVLLPARRSQPEIASIETCGRLVAESDGDGRTIHFRLGAAVGARTVRIARDLLLDVDEANHISGLWLLNVPPAPVAS
jgi:hypothetical protein